MPTQKNKTGVGRFLQTLWNGIKRLFEKANEGVKTLLPVVTELLNNAKLITDSHIGDVLTAIIPGDADDKIVAGIRKFLPKALEGLNLAKEISDIEDPNERLKAILAKINVAPDDTKKVFYHGLASLMVEKLSDGVFSWADATAVAEYYYQNYEK